MAACLGNTFDQELPDLLAQGGHCLLYTSHSLAVTELDEALHLTLEALGVVVDILLGQHLSLIHI